MAFLTNEASQLIERLLRHRAAGTQDAGAAMVARDIADYADPALFNSEQTALFQRLPLLVGHASQAPEPGDYFTVEFAGLPTMIVRQRDGTLRAHINRCRHRGAQLTTAACGHGAFFICPYHGWRYELDGRLTGVSARQSFPDLDAHTRGLVQRPLSVAEGLVFLGIPEAQLVDSSHWLGPIYPLMRAYALSKHRHFRTEIMQRPFNWKIGVEGALETYHFRQLHPATVAALFNNDGTLYDHWEPHQRQCVAKRTLTRGLATSADPVQVLRDQVLQTYFIFPCTLLTVTNDHVLLTFFYPDGPHHCVMVYTMLIPPESSLAGNQAHWERTWKLTHSVLAEDFAVQEGIQRNAMNRARGEILIGREEVGLARFRAAVDQAIAGTR